MIMAGLCLFGLWVGNFPALAQSPDLFFEQRFPYQTLGSPQSCFFDKPYCYVTVIGSDGCCLVTVNHDRSCFYYETESVSPSLVYKVSPQGELLGELTVGYDDKYTFVHGVYSAPDDPLCFLAVGRVHDNELHYDKPFMARFDQDLNLLWRREVELPEAYRNYISFGTMMDSDGNILCSSYLGDCGGGSVSRFVFRLTPEGELDGVNELPFVSDFQKVFEFADGSGDYGLLENIGQETQSEVVLLRMNRDLEVVGQQTLPNVYEEMDPTGTYAQLHFSLISPNSSTSGRHAIAPMPDGTLILSNEAFQTIQGKYESYYGHGILWISPECEAVSCAMDWKDPYYAHDSLVMITPMLPADDDNFYFVYAMGQNSGYDYMNCFVVGKMDFEGNLLWRRYWNRYLPEYGMKIYYPQDAVLSHDNGCLISGFSFESDINAGSNYVYEPNVFLLKFFADGTLSLSEYGTDLGIRPYRIFPNPVGEQFYMEYSPDVHPTVVELYDIQGRLLRTQSEGLENIHMGELPEGTYTLRVVMDDGTSYSDKVVKQ